MKRFVAWAPLIVAGCASIAPLPSDQQESVLAVPGHADFLAVDGRTVWTTNKGHVEQWSLQGKMAEVDMTEPCGAMAVAAGSLWVADCKDGTLTRIDIKTARKLAVISTGVGDTDGELNVVSGAGSVWLASDPAGAVARVDPASNKVIATIRANPGSNYLTFGFGSLWAVSGAGQSLQQIDPRANAVVRTTALGLQPGFLTAGEGAVWVQEQGNGAVARIDPSNGKITGRVKVGETLNYGDIDAGGGRVWLRTTQEQTFVVIDPKSMKVLARVGKASGSGALRYTPAGVWTTAHDNHTMSWWSR